jgi:hypothetical protein
MNCPASFREAEKAITNPEITKNSWTPTQHQFAHG